MTDKPIDTPDASTDSELHTSSFIAFSNTHGLVHIENETAAYRGLLGGYITEAISATGSAVQQTTEFLRLEYVTREESGEDGPESVDVTVASVTTAKIQSHVFIDSKLNNIHARVRLDQAVQFRPEGTMAEYFALYFPEGNHTEALSLFAPDVLSLIMAQYGQYDIEVSDTKLYLYLYKKLDTVAELEKLYRDLQILVQALNNNSPRALRLEKVTNAQPTQGNLTSTRRKPLVLSQYVDIAWITVLIAVAVFAGNKSKDEQVSFMFTVGTIAASIIVVGLFIRHVYFQRKNDRYKQDLKDHTPDQSQ